jgi:hypothetical protein
MSILTESRRRGSGVAETREVAETKGTETDNHKGRQVSKEITKKIEFL